MKKKKDIFDGSLSS